MKQVKKFVPVVISTVINYKTVAEEYETNMIEEENWITNILE